jgi:hypothetical protein
VSVTTREKLGCMLETPSIPCYSPFRPERQ